MATFNQWGDDIDESIGDVIYDSLEQKAKEEAKDLAKDGIEAAGKASSKVLDNVTDHIAPVKTVKDKFKEKLSNNPITRAKAAVKKVKEKTKQAVKKFAREGIQAVARAALQAAKALCSFAAANPLVTIIIIIVLLIIMKYIDIKDEINNEVQSDNVLLESPVYVSLDGMYDDDVVVVLMGDCVNQQYDNMGELDADKEALAKFIYSVFRSYGFNNASIAGMMGNIDIESGLDPSAIEGIFSEYGFLGTKKAEALLSMTHYTEYILFPKYADNGTSINKDGYKVINSEGKTVYYCGMGLVQWTGENAFTLLTAAETLSLDWYDMDFQLAYMMSDCMYRSGFFSAWVVDQEEDTGDPEVAKNAAIKFAHEYEGNTGSDDDRMLAAEEWYNVIKDWDDSYVDESYVDSIVTLATELGSIINFIDVENAQYRCLNGNIFDNSSLANAAVSFAWPTREQSFNNGTNLYQVVHDGIFPTDYVYKACDRCVAMAVMWSGTDDDYPLVTTNQLRYLSSSSKWEEVGMSNSLSVDELQPGDVFILNGHTFIYVGESAITAAYTGEAQAGSDSVSASLGERSAACDSSAGNMINNNGGMDWEGRGAYHVFRCVNPDHSTKYTSIGTGITN